MYSQQVVLLGLLDRSAAFDCVDHEVLLRRLRIRFGICGAAHDWIASFLYGRSQRVLYRGRLSAEWQLLLGVPQVQFWAPYCSYCIRPNASTSLQNAVSHVTSMTTTRISTPATDHVDAMDRLAACIERIRDWMADNHLKLNEEKTQIIWLGTRQQLNKVTARALTLPNAPSQRSSFQPLPRTSALCWTVSSPWPTTLLHSADPAFSTSGSSGL